jgi:hypothetical protein
VGRDNRQAPALGIRARDFIAAVKAGRHDLT